MPKKNKRPQQGLKPKLHIFCEGEKTEPNYLNGYIGRKFPGTVLIKVEKSKKNTPVELVKECLAAQKANPPGDEFWVVYDRESPTKYPDTLHAEARRKAGTKVNIALSNVCFELWLLLHFQETSAAYDCCDELLHKSNLKKKHIKDYDKADRRTYNEAETDFARDNATQLNEETKKGADPAWIYPHQWNPYTDVHKLLDAIDAFGTQYAS